MLSGNVIIGLGVSQCKKWMNM